MTKLAAEEKLSLRPVALDVTSDASAKAGRARARRSGRLDVLIHNSGHMVFGSAEEFTPAQLTHL